MSNAKLKFNINTKKIAQRKLAIICSRFNSEFTEPMLRQAQAVLQKYKIKHQVYRVPGAFEIPYCLAKNSLKYDGFIAIGCLIKGETKHFEYIAGPVSQALVNLSISLKKPIGFGVATCLTSAQARARLDLGAQAAKTVLELLS